MKLRAWLIGALVAGFALGVAVAQTVVLQNLSGNEAVLAQIGGPGGTGVFTTTAVLRNTTGYVLVPGTGTVNTSLTTLQAKAIATSATITTWNVQFPSNAFDGEMMELSCPAGPVPTVSMITVAPVTIVGSAFTVCNLGGAASGTAEWIYSVLTSAWYRIQ